MGQFDHNNNKKHRRSICPGDVVHQGWTWDHLTTTTTTIAIYASKMSVFALQSFSLYKLY
jgi:hypothetical protein